tara:strand:- start:529 stop:2229 length:1701 start_codon:yes stop_codon:yes gene_type:complete
MSEYLVSARKYRPENFKDVVGQEHVTKTLSNAIEHNQIAHAYLFCGPRGVGKTTCARIFSKLINENVNSEYNVFELDGASNNSVDDIRNLIDQVKIPPQIGKYKTYIIDEVHMLSKAAFNAFLKTLEEPPKHSIFILATTEKEKIIPTILSRCQIFDFNRINNQQISSYLLQLATKENIQVDKHTINLIADKADGSLRDALSIFDKIYTFCNTTWQHEEVSKILLSLDTKFAAKLTDLIISKEIHACLKQVNTVLEKGYDSKEIIKILTHYFRNLMMIKDSKTRSLIHEQTTIIDKMLNQANQFSTQQIILALSCLNDCNANYNQAINQRFLVELCIMKLCSLSELALKKKLLIPKANKNIPKLTDQDKKEEHTAIEKKLNKKIINKTENGLPQVDKSINDNIIINSTLEEKVTQQSINSDLISISAELQAMQIEEKKELSNKTENLEWLEKELLLQWNNFAQKLQSNQKINLYNIFDRYLPLKNENNITVQVVSLSEKAELEEIKPELLAFLKEVLKNDFIKINIDVSKEQKKNMLHTKEEKYAHMLSKNEDIKLLQEKLDLTII